MSKLTGDLEMTPEIWAYGWRMEAMGFKNGVRAGREMLEKEIWKEDERRIKDLFYKRRPADEKYDLDVAFFPWDDEKGQVVRPGSPLYNQLASSRPGPGRNADQRPQSPGTPRPAKHARSY